MKFYADASLIVAAFSEETMSDTARDWLANVKPGELFSSRWCRTESASAMAIKVRTGALAAGNLAEMLSAVRRLLDIASTDIPISARCFDNATDFIARCSKPLRGGDALHLAIAASARATLWTLDRRMVEAGQALALDVRLLA